MAQEAASMSMARLLVERVQGTDAAARMAAAHAAGPEGAEAVAPLGALLAAKDPGVAKSAGEALRRITHYAARPGAGKEARAVSKALLKIAEGGSDTRGVSAASAGLLGQRRTAIQLLSYVGGDEAVPGLAKLLKDPQLREDARMTLERIPGRASTRALERALRDAPADFRPSLEQGLSHRKQTLRRVGIRDAR